MVRLYGLISEKSIVPSGTRIIRTGTISKGQGVHDEGSAALGFQAQAGICPTLQVITGFHSVKKGWAVYQMEPAPVSLIGMMGPEGVATAGGNLYLAGICSLAGAHGTSATAGFTIDWYAIGDIQ